MQRDTGRGLGWGLERGRGMIRCSLIALEGRTARKRERVFIGMSFVFFAIVAVFVFLVSVVSSPRPGHGVLLRRLGSQSHKPQVKRILAWLSVTGLRGETSLCICTWSAVSNTSDVRWSGLVEFPNREKLISV
jgi:hypothetical protein